MTTDKGSITFQKFGHGFRFKERKYKGWAVKLQELIDELEREMDEKEPFEKALKETLKNQVTNCELAASIELENYRDRS